MRTIFRVQYLTNDFLKLSAEYENEQAELQKQLKVFEEETNNFDRQQIDFKQFHEIVKNMSALKN